MLKFSNGLIFKDKEEAELYMELGSKILNRDKSKNETYLEVILEKVLEKETLDRFAKYTINNGWDYVCYIATKDKTTFIICNVEEDFKDWESKVNNINTWTILVNPRLCQ